MREANPVQTPTLRQKKRPRQLKFENIPPSNTSAEPKITPQVNGHDYIVTKSENCEAIQKHLPEIEQKIKELEDALAKNEVYKNQVLDLSKIQSNPKQIQFWTGFPNYETMFSLFEFFEPRAKNMRYWRGGNNTEMEIDMKAFYNKRGPDRKLSLLDEFF